MILNFDFNDHCQSCMLITDCTTGRQAGLLSQNFTEGTKVLTGFRVRARSSVVKVQYEGMSSQSANQFGA